MLTHYRLDDALFVKEVPVDSRKWLSFIIIIIIIKFIFLSNNLTCIFHSAVFAMSWLPHLKFYVFFLCYKHRNVCNEVDDDMPLVIAESNGHIWYRVFLMWPKTAY